MNARRDELVAALEANDHDAIKALGWWDIGEVYLTAWAPRQAGTTKDLIPLAKLLGDEDPAAVLDAIEQCAGEWRPVAGQLRAHINKARGENHRVDVGRGRDRSSTPEALAGVADAIRTGERPCQCGPPTLQRWRPDSTYVLRCHSCAGLQDGQIYDAEDAGLLGEAA